MIPRRYAALPEETEQLITAVIDSGIRIHRELGPGFVEAVYRNALCLELADRQVPFEAESGFTVRYRDRPVAFQRVDLLVGGRLIVELKAVLGLEPIHCAQLLSYLRASGLRAGLLMNFGGLTLRSGLRRIVI